MTGPFKIRADLRINDENRKIVLSAIENETPDHLALKLAAALLFWKEDPILDASSKHTALAGQEFRPDLMAADITGSVGLWVECGNTSTHKLSKVVRRWPQARVVLLLENAHKGQRYRDMMAAEDEKLGKVEIIAWPDQTFKEWLGALSEKTEIFGEAGDVSFNLVVNETVYVRDLLRF